MTLHIWCILGKSLVAEAAKPAPDPLVKRKQENEENAHKKQKVDHTKSQEERLKDAVIPFWNTPYEEQVFLIPNRVVS